MLAEFWETFLSGVRKLKQLYLDKAPRTVDDFIDYVFSNVASTVRTYFELNNGDLQSLYNLAMSAKLNLRQKNLIDQKRRNDQNDSG